MTAEPMFGNWLVAVAEAAEVTGAKELDSASIRQMTQAWSLVEQAAGISREELVQNLAHQAGLDVADLAKVDELTTVFLPSEAAHRLNVLPLRCTAEELWVATANPLSQAAKREIAELTGRTITFEVAAPDVLEEEIDSTYGPLTDEERARAAATHVDKEPHGPRVLVVDDEIGQRTLLRSVLEEGGFRVDTVSDGPAAVELLGAEPDIALVTLDYWMDKMNGLRVLQTIRSDADLADTPVIMITGAEDRHIENSLLEAGANDYLPKPVDGPLLVARVQAVLRRHGLR